MLQDICYKDKNDIRYNGKNDIRYKGKNDHVEVVILNKAKKFFRLYMRYNNWLK